MIRKTLVVIAAALALAAGAQAQVTDNDTITVTATVQGVFNFVITAASYDFGTVDAAGTGGGVYNPAIGGAVYTADNATTWTCESAPRTVVDIYNDATSSFAGPVGQTGDNLEVQLDLASNPLGGGSSTGWIDATTEGTPAGDLVTNALTGMGNNDSDGNVDFRLTVLDTHPIGLYTWTIVLTASGT